MGTVAFPEFPFSSHSGSDPPGEDRSTPFVSSHDFFPAKKANSKVRGMSDVAGRNVWLANMTALGAGGGSSGEPAQTADNPGMADIENLQPVPAAASASAATIPTVDEPSKSPEPRGVGLRIGPLMLKQMDHEVVEEA